MAQAVNLAPTPILQFFNNLGQPNVNGTLLTQVGGINYPTYQDALGNFPLPNPIPLNSRGEVSNASGISSQLFLQQNVTYTFTLFDAAGNQLNQSQTILAPNNSNGGNIGATTNLQAGLTVPSLIINFIADEVVVGNVLGGNKYILPNFNQTINFATTGAGGIDTGTVPANGFVSVYAIYNPTTGAVALLGCNALTSNGSIYSGVNMPTGYVASALIGSLPTTGSQVPPFKQANQFVWLQKTIVLNTSTLNIALTSLSLASTVPANAISVFLTATGISIIGTGPWQLIMQASVANTIGQTVLEFYTSGQNVGGPIQILPITNTQNVAVTLVTSGLTNCNTQIWVNGYLF